MKNTFLDDKEKMRDFFTMDKQAFLESYSYLPEEEYDNTAKAILDIKIAIPGYGPVPLSKIAPVLAPACPPVKTEDKAEFVGQIIDIFEDFLDEKDITIENEERDEDPDINPESAAIIYGSDYGALQDELEAMLRNWKIINEE